MTDLRSPHPRLLALRSRHPRALHWLVHLSPLSLFAVAAIDFSLIPLPVPNPTDLLLLWLAARGGNPWFLVPSAVVGSVLGGYTTWHVGWKSGRRALRRYGSIPLLRQLSEWIERHPLLSAIAAPLLPPPVPLAPFVLASGALGVPPRRFFPAFGVLLTLRYVLLAWLGKVYGRHIVRVWAGALRKLSPALSWVFAALLMAGIGFGVWKALARRRSASRNDQFMETAVPVMK